MKENKKELLQIFSTKRVPEEILLLILTYANIVRFGKKSVSFTIFHRKKNK